MNGLHGAWRWGWTVGKFGLGLLTLLTAISWFGAVHEYADISSHFRLHYAVGLGAVAIFMIGSRRYGFALAALLLAALNLGSALFYPHKPLEAASIGKPLKVVTLNTLHWADNTDKIVQFIRNETPDIIFLQELPIEKLTILNQLANDYPWQKHCAEFADCGLAMLSRAPWDEASIVFRPEKNERYVWARFGPDFANMTVAGIHLKWPYFSNQRSDLETVYQDLPKSGGPVLIAGDFNATPWSWMLRSFAAANNLWPAGPFRPTWPVRKFAQDVLCGLCIPQIQIDNILVSDQINILNSHTGPHVGSDHLPLIVDIAVPRQAVAQANRSANSR